MAHTLQERVAARNRRQRAHGHELRLHAVLHQYVRRFRAERKIKRSREMLGQQVTRSKRMAMRAKRKAIDTRKRARRR